MKPGAFIQLYVHLVLVVKYRDNVYRYIENQEQHYGKESFRDEYIGFLEKYGVDYEPLFLFEFLDDRV